MKFPQVSVDVAGNYHVKVMVGEVEFNLPLPAPTQLSWPISPVSSLAQPEPIYRLPDDWVCSAITTPLSEIYDWSFEFSGVPKLWAETRGEGLKICVLDTGVDDTHSDLQKNLKESRDFTGSLNGPRDVVGHGCWCCGLLCAEAGNDYGVAGIANKADLYSGKVLGDNGAGTDKTIAKGIEFAVEVGADIVSLSLGGGRMSEWLHAVFREFVSQPRKFIFAASGNDGASVNYPGAWIETIGVGAVGRDGRLTRFTSRGPQLDILAPGVDMLSTIPVNQGSFGTMTGTSMATPFAAGVGALALAKHLKLGGTTGLETMDDMRAHLKKTGINHGDGYGLIDPAKFLAGLAPPVPEQPPPSVPTPDDGFVFDIPYVGRFAIRSPAVAGDLVSLRRVA